MSALRLAALAVFVMFLSTSVAAWPAPLPVDVLPGEPHAPIVIDGNAQFTAANGVRSGSGTEADPYVIGDWWIPTTATAALVLRNTEAHVLIEDVSAALPTDDALSACNAFCSQTTFIQLDGAANVTLRRVDAGETAVGFEVLSSRHVAFEHVKSGSDAVVLPKTGAAVGFFVWRSTDVSVSMFMAKNVRQPLMVAESSDVAITRSVILEGSMSIRDSRRVSFDGNAVHGGSVSFENSVEILLAENSFQPRAASGVPSVFAEPYWLVYLDHVDDGTICGNHVVGSPYVSFILDHVDGVRLFGNRFANSFAGVAVDNSAALFERNVFEGNFQGALASGRAVFQDNAFVGNGVGLDGAVEVTATHNWWGHPSGPSGNGIGSGDSVFGAAFSPWLATEPQLAVSCA